MALLIVLDGCPLEFRAMWDLVGRFYLQAIGDFPPPFREKITCRLELRVAERSS